MTASDRPHGVGRGGPGPVWRRGAQHRGGVLLLPGADGELVVHVAASHLEQEAELLAALDRFALARVGDAVRRRMREPAPAGCACSCGGPCRGGAR